MNIRWFCIVGLLAYGRFLNLNVNAWNTCTLVRGARSLDFSQLNRCQYLLGPKNPGVFWLGVLAHNWIKHSTKYHGKAANVTPRCFVDSGNSAFVAYKAPPEEGSRGDNRVKYHGDFFLCRSHFSIGLFDE